LGVGKCLSFVPAGMKFLIQSPTPEWMEKKSISALSVPQRKIWFKERLKLVKKPNEINLALKQFDLIWMALGYHGFLGTEDQVVQVITDWASGKTVPSTKSQGDVGCKTT
jgi:hypothetical protein